MKFKLKNAKKLDKAQAFQPVALSSSSFPVNDLPSEQADNIIRTFIKKVKCFWKIMFQKVYFECMLYLRNVDDTNIMKCMCVLTFNSVRVII